MAGWGGGTAAACLTVLSVWRWQDGEVGWAVVLLALAFVQLAVLAHRISLGRAGAAARTPDPAAARRHLPTWRAIGVAGVLGALATVAFAPPLALVLAGLGLVATWRARSYGRVVASA